MNKHATIYIYLISCVATACITLPLHAQKGTFVKQVAKAATGKPLSVPLERKLTGLQYVPPKAGAPSSVRGMRAPFLPQARVHSNLLLGDKAVSLSDGRGTESGKHSIVPSAVTVLGSPAIARSEERTIMALRQQAQVSSTAEYIPTTERARWREEFEALHVLWMKADPSKPEDLPQYLTHQVPAETLSYLQREYAELIELVNNTQHEIMPKVVYSFLQNEGRQYNQEEKAFINNSIYQVRSQIAILLKAIKTDPWLLVQQKYWDRMFGAFNPLLKGVLSKPGSIFRQDKREFVLSEFALHNPDGSSPYLPQSDSMIAGESNYDDEDDDFDEEQYSGTPQALQRQAARQAAQRQHNAQMVQLAEQERDALLPYMPENQRIAVINDDLLPLINFQGWAKKGYLGKNATVSTFRNGFDFMQEIKRGTRYDIVITDLVLPDGGVAMMENFRILDPDAVVFASSKFYPGDGDDFSARDLFNFGMDGYIWNNSNLNEGSFGYLQYLRQLKNYYYYKNKYNWQR